MSSKELKAKVRKQMEFYFSEGNLPKDDFLQEQLQRHADGYVPLEVFLCFNKLRPLVQSVSQLARCLKKSNILELNDDKTGVRRQFAMKQLEPVDDRTVYLEGLPANADADDLASWFSKAVGKVLFVSLPRYRSTGDGKRFGFVEFENSSDAQSAVILLSNNGKPSGIFPIANKQLWRLRQHAEYLGIDVTALEKELGAGRTVLPPYDEAADPMESLRAASKKTWMRLKRAHFRATRRFHQQLEQRIAAAQKGEAEKKEKEEEVVTKPFDLPPGSVFALSPASDVLLSKADIRAALSDVGGEVSYIDVTAPGAVLVRCNSEAAAQHVTAFIAKQCPNLGTTRRLSTEEELLYSRRIAEDREKKQNKRKRLTERRKRQEVAPQKEENGDTRKEENGHARNEQNGRARKEENGHAKKEENGHARKEENGRAKKEENGRARKEENGRARKEENGHAAPPPPPLPPTPCAQLREDEEEEEDELMAGLLGTVVALRDAPKPLTKASLRAALAPVADSVAYLDVIAGDTVAFVRCKDCSAAAAVAERLGASGLGAASRLEGQEERQYLGRVLRSRGLKKARNARRKLREEEEDPPAKRAKR